ncbi:MAG: Abi family protein [Bacteroidales bacterium]|nr:Abi family protein [Bacteroidales bacterium]
MNLLKNNQEKRAFSIDEQIQCLKDNGMVFDNEDKAREVLLDIGYYRFGFYSFPFEITFPALDNRDHKLKPGTSFKSVFEIYEFDSKLRRIILNVLDRIEVNIRTCITYYGSLTYIKDPYWFVNSNYMESSFIRSFEDKVYSNMRDHPVIKHHHQNHKGRYAPAWKTMEFMTLGNVVALYTNMKDITLKRKISNLYGCSIGVFQNYLETLRILRNKCAHGECIYRLSLARGIKLKPANISPDCRHNISGALSVVRFILGFISINRKKDLEDELRSLIANVKSPDAKRIILDCSKILL